MSWHEDDSEFDSDLEDSDTVIYLIRHPNGKLYQATVVDHTDEGGAILEIESRLVTAKIFPERHIDSRYLKSYGYELFIVPRPNGWTH